MTTKNPLALGRRMRPTLKHRPAVWECMLGTVYAMNDDGEVKYFDYKWDEAVAFAGVTADRDPRTHKPVRHVRWSKRGGTDDPSMRQLVLWITQ